MLISNIRQLIETYSRTSVLDFVSYKVREDFVLNTIKL